MKEVYNLYYGDEQINNASLTESDIKEIMSHEFICSATHSGKIIKRYPTSKIKVRKRLII